MKGLRKQHKSFAPPFSAIHDIDTLFPSPERPRCPRSSQPALAHARAAPPRHLPHGTLASNMALNCQATEGTRAKDEDAAARETERLALCWADLYTGGNDAEAFNSSSYTIKYQRQHHFRNLDSLTFVSPSRVYVLGGTCTQKYKSTL